MHDIDVRIPRIARVYDYWLGGRDNFAADRALGDRALAAFPNLVHTVRANRAFLARSVYYLAAERGIRQFLDVGAGLPATNNTHEVAQRAAPDSRVVYVDNDPVVMSHARALLKSAPPGACGYVDADLRDAGAVLAGAAQTLDFARPLAVLLLSVLHYVADDEVAEEAVSRLMAGCQAGGYLVITHVASDIEPDRVAEMSRRISEGMPLRIKPRNRAEVIRLFAGLDLFEPGVVTAPGWRPDYPAEGAVSAALWAGVGAKNR